MTIYDFCNLCTSDLHDICIYDMTTEKEVFNGTISDAMYSDYADYEVLSFDLEYSKKEYLCLNIETE